MLHSPICSIDEPTSFLHQTCIFRYCPLLMRSAICSSRGSLYSLMSLNMWCNLYHVVQRNLRLVLTLIAFITSFISKDVKTRQIESQGS